MKQKILKIINILLSFLPKKYHNKIDEIYNSYITKQTPKCLIFNQGEKKRGFLSVGYEPRCDIRFEVGKPIHMNIPDDSIEIVEIDFFLELIDSDDLLWEFFREIGRILKRNGLVKIKFIDYEYILTDEILLDIYQNNNKKYFYSKKVLKVNTVLSHLGKAKRFLDLSSLTKILRLLGFNVTEQSHRYNSAIKIINIIKKPKRYNLWKLTSTLPRDNEILNDAPIYLSDCDSSLILDSFTKINIKKLVGRNFFSVIGSLFFINLIPILKPKALFLFDINSLQVRYLKLIIEIIKQANSYSEFLEKFFSRKYNRNTKIFLSSPANFDKYKKVRESVRDKEICDLTIGKIAKGRYLELDNIVPVLEIDNNSMCQAITIVGEEYFKPGPRINVIHSKSGLAKNFSYIKKKLLNAEVFESKIEDPKVLSKLNLDSVIYVSNIGEEDWINGIHSDYTRKEFDKIVSAYKLSAIFKKQWIESVKGFKKFISDSKENFWIIDSVGNIFTKNELLLERSDSHMWLWDKIRKKIVGKSIEVIHKRKGTWGFKEYLKTINYKTFLVGNHSYDTIILHILLGNGIPIKSFLNVLYRASVNAKRIIIIEHDRDSVNFGAFSNPSIVDVRTLMKMVRSIDTLDKASINIEWTGASKRIDKKLYDDKPNYNRNMIVTIDL